MGQWLRFFFERQGLKVLVAGRKTPLTLEECAKRAAIIIVCVPIDVVEDVIKNIAPFIRKNALLTDITSVKVRPLRAMKKAKSATLGMHPLFGPTPGELSGQTIVFCRQKDNKYVSLLKDLFQKSGIEVVEIDAQTHDKTTALIQALTHTINLLLAKSLITNYKLPAKVHTPIFSLQSLVIGRVLEQDLSLLADIQIYNPHYLPILKKFFTNAQKLALLVSKKGKQSFVDMFSGEQQHIGEFANFAKLATSKILSEAKEVPTSLPAKIKTNGISLRAKIAYLGPQGTYSYEAAKNIFPKNHTVPYSTLYDLFNTVTAGDAELAVVPAENSIGGTVAETLDYLVDFPLFIVGSYELPVHHCLVSREYQLASIKKVVSHPQAIAQCRQWLRTTLPQVQLLSSQSTTDGLKNAKNKYGYLASTTAAKKYHLNVLAKNVEDVPSNKTKFYLLAKNLLNIPGLAKDKTLLFLAVYNRVGILRDILNIFADNNINLTKLESRPSRVKAWDYHFFVEVEKACDDKDLVNVLEELKVYCPIIRILGQT